MKTVNKKIILFLALSLLTPTIVSAKGGTRADFNKRQPVIAVLSSEQEDTLLWMREEEKIARDVYLAMDKKWNQAIFRNIASAEQKHMNAVLKKINSFRLTDPALPEISEFSTVELQAIYDNLINKGNQSYIDALKVGASIEDMDIYDLQQAIEETDDLALKTTYENLLEGSKNHLRAFIGRLQKQGEQYRPEFITQELFDAIVGLY